MALSHGLAEAGAPPEELRASATATFVPGTGITTMHPDLFSRGTVKVLAQLGLLTTIDGVAFEAYCTLVARWRDAEDALKTHGWLRGGALALYRVGRCHPLARGGLDPVPAASRNAQVRA
jgi:hypothetical protein